MTWLGELHQHPDGHVYVRVGMGNAYYVDSAENLAIDSGLELPALPEGADERIYQPEKRHAIMGDGNIVAGGPMPWELGDSLIAMIPDLLIAQEARRNPPPTLEQAKAAKDAAIEVDFQARHAAPIAFEVGGQSYLWHADREAVTNIMGVVLMIASGVPVTNPRNWTPKDQLTPVSITHAELIGLGAAIATRKDALFVIKKTKQAEVAALDSPSAVAAYDTTSGW